MLLVCFLGLVSDGLMCVVCRIQSVDSSPIPLLRMVFPALILFNASHDTSILSLVMNKNMADAGVLKIFIDASYDVDVRRLADGSYAMSFSIDVMGLITVCMEKILELQHALLHDLTEVDQGTGAGFSALIPVLWAATANEFLSQFNGGECVAVMSGVVRSVVTQDIAAGALATLSLHLQISPPQILFLVDQMELESFEFAYALHSHGVLKYTHTAACDVNELVSKVQCRAPYPTLLISSYSSDSLVNKQKALGEATVHNLEQEHRLALSLSMRGVVNAVGAFQCPRNMRTRSINLHAGVTQRVCVSCPGGSYYNGETNNCVPCTNTGACSGRGQVSCIEQQCSWTHDNISVPLDDIF